MDHQEWGAVGLFQSFRHKCTCRHFRDCTPAPPGLGTCHANAQDSLDIHHLKTVLFLAKDTGGKCLGKDKKRVYRPSRGHFLGV